MNLVSEVNRTDGKWLDRSVQCRLQSVCSVHMFGEACEFPFPVSLDMYHVTPIINILILRVKTQGESV